MQGHRQPRSHSAPFIGLVAKQTTVKCLLEKRPLVELSAYENYSHNESAKYVLYPCSRQANGQLAFLRTNGDLTKPTPLFCCPVKSHSFDGLSCKLKTTLIAKSQLLYMGSPLKRAKQKGKPNFNCRKCPLTRMCKYRV